MNDTLFARLPVVVVEFTIPCISLCAVTPTCIQMNDGRFEFTAAKFATLRDIALAYKVRLARHDEDIRPRTVLILLNTYIMYKHYPFIVSWCHSKTLRYHVFRCLHAKPHPLTKDWYHRCILVP